MVAYLQDSALDDERLAAKIQEHRAKGSSMPLFHEAMQKWYYKDPQGEIQGRSVPFTLPLLFHRIVKRVLHRIATSRCWCFFLQKQHREFTILELRFENTINPSLPHEFSRPNTQSCALSWLRFAIISCFCKLD